MPTDTQHWYSGVQSFYSKDWHVPRYPKAHILTRPRVSKDAKKPDVSYVARGKVALLLNQTHTNYIIQQSYFWVFTREIKTYLHTKTCTQIFIAPFICNNQNLETTQTPFNRWIDKQIVVHPYTGSLPNREQAVNTCNNCVDGPQGHYAKRKKPISRSYIL